MRTNRIASLDPYALTQDGTFTESGYITPTISPPSTVGNFSSMEMKNNKPFTTISNVQGTETSLPLAR